MKEDYNITHKADGVCFNWNVFPSTRLEASQLLSPIGCLYTPLHQRSRDLQSIPIITDKLPIRCDGCENYINPYVKIDRANRMWVCPYCQDKSFLPNDFPLPNQGASYEDWPVELRQSSSTIEYELPNDIAIASDNYNPTYWFILDLYQHIDEIEQGNNTSMNSLKLSVCKAIDNLPDNSLVGIISFDENVYCHKLTLKDSIAITKGDIFDVDLETDNILNEKNAQLFDFSVTNKVLKKLDIIDTSLSRDFKTSPLVEHNYLTPINNSTKANITNYIKSLKPTLTNSYKPPRSTGLSIYVLSLLLSKASYKGFIGNVNIFTSGPCTNAPGNIIDIESSKSLRSHNDIVNLEIPQFLSSLKFYKTLSLIASGISFENAHKLINTASGKETDYPVTGNSPKWTINLFTGSLDQVGIYEMKSLASHTMGGLYLYDSFNSPQFCDQLVKLFTNVESVNDRANATLTIRTSSKLKVSRMIGHGHNLPSSYQSEKHYDLHHQKISDHLSQYDSSLKKKNFTNQWLFNTLNPQDTISIFFEPEVVNASSRLEIDGVEEYYIQFQLKYWDFKTKTCKLRITNVTRKSTLHYLIANKVKMSNNTYRIINTKSKIIKEKELLESFDQNVFIILLTRLLLDKIDTTLGYEKFDNVVKDIDKVVIKLLHYFGGLSLNFKSGLDSNNPYANLLSDVVEKYEINHNFKDLPTIAYNLRKNQQLIRIFNSLPDETAYYHHWYLNSSYEVSKIIIEPNLYQVDEHSAKNISLDSHNISRCPANSFLIMDSIFSITIYSNDTSRLDLHHSDNASMIYNNNESLQVPLDFIKTLPGRPISPKFIVTQKAHSQARFLLSRLNPIEDTLEQNFQKLSVTSEKPKRFFGIFKKPSSQSKVYEELLTDDISLDKYYNSLIQSVNHYVVSDEY